MPHVVTDGKHRLEGFDAARARAGAERGFAMRSAGTGRRSSSCTGSAARSRTGARSRRRSPPSIASSSPICRATDARRRCPKHATSTRLPKPSSGFADAEEMRGAVWVGHSLGGVVALRAAVLRPDAVRGARPRRGGRNRLGDPRRPGDAHRPRRRTAGAPDRAVPARVGALAARPPGRVRLVGRGGSRRARSRARRGLPRRARASHRHAPGGPGLARLGPAHRARPRHLPVPLPLGSERQLGPCSRTGSSTRAACARRCGRSPAAATS